MPGLYADEVQWPINSVHQGEGADTDGAGREGRAWRYVNRVGG